MAYISRALEPIILRAAKEFPVVVLSGPRQAGKTTLLRHLLGKTHQYVSLELPDVQASAHADPRGFLELYPPPVVFDEVHFAPDLLPYIKERVDADRTRSGQYILTGSQNILLNQRVSETLAGRAAMLRLLPLSLREATGHPKVPLPWQEGRRPMREPLPLKELWARLLRGGYPELEVSPKRDLGLWHGSYVQTYLERDVRTLRQVGDLTQFQMFLRALAARSASLLNLSDLARDLGLAVNTIKAWLSVLEASHQVLILRPYFANLGKRLVKTPKVYFTDTGTLCYLAGLKEPQHAMEGPMGGAIMETAVVGEVARTLTHQGVEPALYFWRTSDGQEVDLVVDAGAQLVPLEVKLTATPRPAMAKSVAVFRGLFGSRAAQGYLVHPGEVKLPLSPGVTAWPLSQL